MLSFNYLIAWYTKLDGDYLNPAALDRAYQAALRATQLVPNLPQAHAQLSLVLVYRREHDAAVAALERARELNPNLSDWRSTAVLTFAGDAARAIEVGRTYARLDPFYPAFATGYLGLAHYVARDYAEAARLLREFVARSPNNRPAHEWLTATYAQMGQLERGRFHAGEVLRIQPGWTIEGSVKVMDAFRFPQDAEHFFEGFRKAGLPER
jgi:adenylate cyclase